MRWREAMDAALYGDGGFFTRPGPGPAGHFRTSAHTSPSFARALATLVARVDAALGHPDRLDLVDVGGGRGELVTALLAALDRTILSRVRAEIVERAPRPAGLDPAIGWRDSLPADLTGVLLATEWLDNEPVDVAEVSGDAVRYVLVDPDGAERPGPAVEPADAAWLAEWWPVRRPGDRAEIGAPRDTAWADAVTVVTRGLALAVDYGHTRADRPPSGTLTGYRDGRQVPPTPDGSCDLTAHVAVDAVAAAGERACGVPPLVLSQRAALRALGVDGRRPPLELARTEPAAYLRALAEASVAAELTDAAGLGGHYWLLQPVRLTLPEVIPEVGYAA